jgi:hypothetical protein
MGTALVQEDRVKLQMTAFLEKAPLGCPDINPGTIIHNMVLVFTLPY